MPPKVVANCCLIWIMFHDDLYCCVNTQVYTIKLRSSKPIIKSDAQKHMVEFGFERIFHDLKYFEVGFFFFKYFHIP